MNSPPRFLPAGDKALVVELGESISPEVNQRVRDLAVAIDMSRQQGIIEVVPAYCSLLIYYNPLLISFAQLEEHVTRSEAHLDQAVIPAPKTVEIPTVYGGAYGPDLEYVASHHGTTPEEVIAIHSGTAYLVYMMGFTPGFPYLGGLSERIATPRLPSPRTSVPAGSVGIAEQQTGIYPVDSPGGWRIIGRTPCRLFDPLREPPFLVEPGDRVRFVAISEEAYLELRGQA